MDNESRGSLDTTISHSSHATDLYTVSHNHYDVPRDVIELGGRAGDYEMWQLPQHVTKQIIGGTKTGGQLKQL